MQTIAFTLISFIFFTALVGLISGWITRKSDDKGAKGYFMASGGLTGWFIAGSMLLTNLSAEQLIGLNGDAYGHNLSAMAWEATAAVATVVLAMYFLPRYLKGGFTTLPQYLEERFDATTRRFVSLMFILGYTFVANPSGLYLGSIAFNEIFKVQQLTGMSYNMTISVLVWSMGIIGALYAIFGGLRAVAVSDTINGLGLLVAGLMVPILGLIALGGGSFGEGLHIITTNAPEKLNAIGSATDSVPFGTIFTGMVFANLFYWCTNQSIIQRTLAAKSLAEGQKGVLFSGLIKILVPIVMLIPGVIAYHYYAGNPLPKPDFAYPVLVRDILPWWLTGFFVAALFGTVMSHFNAIINSTATLVAYDFYRAWKPNATDEQMVRVGKISSVLIAVLSLIIAPLLIYAPDGIYTVMRRFTGFYNIPIIAVVLVGFFTSRVSAVSAKTVLFMHVVVYTLLIFVFSIDKRSGVHFLHIMGMLFVLEVALMLALGKLFPRATVYQPTIRNPGEQRNWRYAKSMSTFLMALLVSAYLTFSPFGVANETGLSNSYYGALGVLWLVAAALIVRFQHKEALLDERKLVLQTNRT
ncbi:solute:sodium symporter family transporter [Neisseriaceae bacterium TC5R-5]|nr:solute:sodium symporter family transporter [Neisseriaceae bacterium TC5R-5]